MSVTAASHPLFATKAPWLMGKLMRDFPIGEDDAAAIIGNAGHESLGFTKLQEMAPTVKGSRGGWGWFQWTGPRRRAFEAYCSRHGYDQSSDDANYKWLFIELSTTEAKAISAVKAAKGLEAKVKAFERAFERAGVKHYPSRVDYAELALKAFKGSKAAPVVPAVITVPMPINIDRPGGWLSTLGGLFGSAKAAVPTAPTKRRPGLASSGDVVLYDQQEMLSDKGWTEVGQPDGLLGDRTEGAVANFRRENSLPAGNAIDEKFSAALLTAGPRLISKQRAETTVQDLRRQGNSEVKAFDSFGTIGKVILGCGILDGVQKSGVIEQASGTLQAMQEAFGALAQIVGMTLTAVNFLLSNMWVVYLVVGIWLAAKAVDFAAGVAAKVRQGLLLRADK